MSFNVLPLNKFKREFKKLAKKHKSLKNDLFDLTLGLEQNPTQGMPLGKDCYKIRMAIKSKEKGKSGGTRVVTCVKVVKENVYLLSIFDKSKRGNITDKELIELLEEIP